MAAQTAPAPMAVQQAVQTAPLVAQANAAPAAPVALPVARRRAIMTTTASAAPSAATTADDEKGAGGNPLRGFHSLSERVAGLNDPDGVWDGTGVGDPAPLQGISDKDMLARAQAAGRGFDRLGALVSIGRRHLPEALPTLQKALDPNEDAMVRDLALAGLIEHGGEGVLPIVWQVARQDPDPMLRGKALSIVGMYGQEGAKKAVEAAWADSDPTVTGRGILVLPMITDEAFVRQNVLRALEHEDQMVWQEALYVLMNTDTSWSRHALADAYEKSKDQRRIVVRSALERALELSGGRLD